MASQMPLRASLSTHVLLVTPGAKEAVSVPPGAPCWTILLWATRTGTMPACMKQKKDGGRCPEPVTPGLCTCSARQRSHRVPCQISTKGDHGRAPRRTGVRCCRGEVRAPSLLSRGQHRAPHLCSQECQGAGCPGAWVTSTDVYPSCYRF